jgi:hypothetical protein
MSTQLFSEFITDLAKRRSLRRDVDGSRITYRLKLEGTSVVTIVTDETNRNSTAKITSESWPEGSDPANRIELMRNALNFNRNAFHHLPCAILRDPDASTNFKLIWWIPPIQCDPNDWRDQLILFGKLASKAWTVMTPPSIEHSRGPSLGEAGYSIFIP